MCFWFIPKTAWMASSWASALVSTSSLQPIGLARMSNVPLPPMKQIIEKQKKTKDSWQELRIYFPNSFLVTTTMTICQWSQRKRFPPLLQLTLLTPNNRWPKPAKPHDTNKRLFHNNEVEKMKDIDTPPPKLERAFNILCIPTYLPTYQPNFILQKQLTRKKEMDKMKGNILFINLPNFITWNCKYNKVEGKWTKERQMWITKPHEGKHAGLSIFKH